MYDVIVIGGGVVGTLILRELSKYHANCLLLEKCDDVSVGASRANSGIVHAGYDPDVGTLKSKFNVEGARMMPSLAKELDVPFKEVGSLVVGDENSLDALKLLKEKGLKNGVEVEILARSKILELEPNVSDNICYALYAPKAGIISPYKLTIKSADHAVINGQTIFLEKNVVGIKKIDFGYNVICDDASSYDCKILINSAGGGANEINQLLNDEIFEIENNRGDYFLLDSREGAKINTVLFPLPDKLGKGILVAPTADGNVIYGPTSIKSGSGDLATTAESLDLIKKGVTKTYKNANYRNVIRLYSGMRCSAGNDFIIKESSINKNYVMLVGICSPGLTASPSIARYVVNEFVKSKLNLKLKEDFKALPMHPKLSAMTRSEINQLIKKDERYGKIVCRCERVSEAEIIDAIHSPLRATTVDAIKRRTRAGMGRCQGGFCMPIIIKILAKALNLPLTDIKKGGKGSQIAILKISELHSVAKDGGENA